MEPNEISRKTFPLVRRGYDQREVEAFLHEVASEYRMVIQAKEQALRASDEAGRAAVARRSPSQDFQDIGSHVAAILASAVEAAEEMKATSEQDSEAILGAAMQEAAEVHEQATQQLAAAEQERARTEREAAAARAAIGSEAARTQKEAEERAATIEAEARQTALRIEQTVRRNIDEILAGERSKCERLRTVQQRCLDRFSSLESLIRDTRMEVSSESVEDPFQAALAWEVTSMDLAHQR